jgi:hypothetical protein
MRRKVAESSLVYVSPDTFDLNPKIAGAGRPDADSIWWAQVGLWIQQDVAAAILATNKNAKNVIDAPVKHLVQFRMVQGFQTGGAVPAAAADPATADATPVTKNPLFVTGRASNALYDVIHFNLVVNMEAAHVPTFIRELSRNRFMSVTQLSLHTPQPVNPNEASAGYIYGDAPIVTATMTCEALFLRQWTVPLMPKSIKLQLGIPEPGAAPAPAAPTAAAF